MKTLRLALAALPLLAMAASPALAADDMAGAELRGARAAFAGLNLKLALDGRGRVAPSARLAMGYSRYEGAGHRSFQAPAFELGLTRAGKPELRVAGERVRDAGARLGVAPGVAIAIGLGIAAGGAVVVSAMAEEPKGICPPGVEVCAQ
jgi:hypothetical protein